MTADEIKALVERLRKHSETGSCMEGTMTMAERAADALTAMQDQLLAKSALANLYAASLRKVEAEVEGLKHDNDSMRDSLTKESVARCEAEDLLGEVAALKRHDPNGVRGFKRSTLTLNMPHGLLERIDAARSQSEEKP